MQAVRKLCDEKDLVLIVDEVQTGVGRTGTFLCCEHYGLKPDIVTLAKGLGGGLPIGAVLMNEKVAAGMGPGTHGSTFGGNPVVCAGANVVVDRMDTSFLANVNERAVQLLSLIHICRGCRGPCLRPPFRSSAPRRWAGRRPDPWPA